MVEDKENMDKVEENVENTITPEEFRDIEKKEELISKEKGGGLFKRKSAKEEDSFDNVDYKDTSVSDLVVKLERVGGRIEMLENYRLELGQQIRELAEKIGELRSSVIESDKNYRNLIKDFDKVSDISRQLEPEKIFLELEKKEGRIEKNQAKLESVEEKISTISRKFSELSDDIEKVKSLKDIVSVADELNNKIRLISELKNKTEKTASKVDTLFYELNEKLSNFQTNLNKIETNEDSIKELLRQMDKLSIKFENLVPKKDLDDAVSKMEEKVSEFEFDTDSKFSGILDIVKKMDRKISGTSVNEIGSELETYRQEFEKKTSELLEEFENKLGDTIKVYKEIKPKRGKISDKGQAKLRDLVENMVEKKLKSDEERVPAEKNQKEIVKEITNYGEIEDLIKAKIKEEISAYSEKLDKLENLDKVMEDKLKSNLSPISDKFSKLDDLEKATDEKIKTLESEAQKKADMANFDQISAKLSEFENKINTLNEPSKKGLEEGELSQKISELKSEFETRLNNSMNSQEKLLSEKLSELASFSGKFDRLDELLERKLTDKTNLLVSETENKFMTKIDEFKDYYEKKLEGFYSKSESTSKLLELIKENVRLIENNLKDLSSYEDQKEKEIEAQFEVVSRHIDDSVELRLNRLFEEKENELNSKFASEKEELENKFSDVELRMIDLMHHVDKKTSRDYSDYGARSRVSEEKPVEKVLVKKRTLSDIIKEIDFSIKSGNYEEARKEYIQLLSEYDREENNDPKILMKITDFHNKLKVN